MESLRRLLVSATLEELPSLLGSLVELEESARLRIRLAEVQTESDEVRLLTMPEVAERLQVHEETVREMGRRGEIRTVQVGRQIRVPLSGLRNWLKGQEWGTWRS